MFIQVSGLDLSCGLTMHMTAHELVQTPLASSRTHQVLLHVQCGLDTSKKVETPLEEQVAVFTAQLELSKELKRPISVSAPHVSSFSWQ